MARNFSDDQRALLRSSVLRARLLTTWYMDGGTFYYCDDTQDLTWNSNLFIGANALASATEIRSAASGWAAESVTITVDGTRLGEAGMTDPAIFFAAIFALDLSNRRVDIDLALMGETDENPVLVFPLYAGKINNAKLVDPNRAVTDIGVAQQSKLEIVLDSLAARYQWIVGRTRTHEDQLEIDPTDMFFSFVHDNMQNEQTLYWGKKAPAGIGAGALNGVPGGLGGSPANFDISSLLNRIS